MRETAKTFLRPINEAHCHLHRYVYWNKDCNWQEGLTFESTVVRCTLLRADILFSFLVLQWLRNCRVARWIYINLRVLLREIHLKSRATPRRPPVRSQTASLVNVKTGRFALLRLALGINELGNRLARNQYIGLSDSFLVWRNWAGNLAPPKLSGIDHSAQTRQVQINSLHLHLHAPPNPTCSRWSDLERLKAHFKPDSPPPCLL